MAQVAERRKIPYLVPYSAANRITESGLKYTFRTRPPSRLWVDAMYKYLDTAAKQSGKPLGFSVCEDLRIITEKGPAFGHPSPCMGIAAYVAGAALDLDEKEAARRQDENIDFIDLPGVVDELKVCPRAPRIMVRQVSREIRQRLPFPGIFAFVHRPPARRRHRHYRKSPIQFGC